MNEARRQSLLDYFRKDRFAAENGMELIDIRPGYAKARMTIAQRHYNSLGILHGGAMFTLADLAFAGACNGAGHAAVSVHATMACVKAVKTGEIFAEAVEVSRSRKISTCTVRVTTAEDELIALFQGTAYVKSDPFPPHEA